jgi:hypothetical protein
MNSSVERFKKRKAVLDGKILPDMAFASPPTAGLSEAYVHSSVAARLNAETALISADADRLLSEIHGKIDDEKFSALIEACQNDCLQAVIRPFGLARILFVDKEGGSVDTIHNVSTQSKDRKGNRRFLAEEKRTTESGEVTATSREYTIDQRGKATYVDDGSVVSEKVIKSWSRPIFVFATDGERRKHDQAINHSGEVAKKVRGRAEYSATVEETRKQLEAGTLADPLSRNGQNFSTGESVHVDHTVPCIEIARDARVSLADIPVDRLANMKINLMPMREYANTSKNGDPVKLVVTRWEKNIQAISKIEDLRSTAPLTTTQEEALRKLKEIQAMDLAKLMEADETVRDEITRIVKDEYYFGTKFRDRVVNTSVSAGLKMGMQQAVGVLMEEFVRAAFAEVKDTWKNGFKGTVDDAFLDALKLRLMRIALRVQSKWKGALSAAVDGGISGFLSNLVNVIINVFTTTEAHVARMLREGFMSLYGALRTLAIPSEGQSLAQAADAALKVLATGVMTTAGIGLQVSLEAKLVILGPLAPYVSSIGAGMITGLGTAFAVYMLDYLDLFGVNAQSRHEHVVAKLNGMISISYERAEKAASVFGGPTLLHLT